LQRDNNLAGKIQREWTLYHYYLFRNLQNLKRKQIMIVYNFQQELCTIVFHLQGQIEKCRKFIFPYYIYYYWWDVPIFTNLQIRFPHL
jgi:hypothetical protein